jgi:hypothetical protein
MTGVSVLQYYSPAIFAAIGFSTETTLLMQSINSVLALIGEACCVAFIDKVCRLPILAFVSSPGEPLLTLLAFFLYSTARSTEASDRRQLGLLCHLLRRNGDPGHLPFRHQP